MYFRDSIFLWCRFSCPDVLTCSTVFIFSSNIQCLTFPNWIWPGKADLSLVAERKLSVIETLWEWRVIGQRAEESFQTSDRMRSVSLHNVIRFSLRVPDSSQSTGGWREPRGAALPARFQVTSTLQKCQGGRQRATRASVPVSALEISPNQWSVVLHLPIVASRARPWTETPLREAEWPLPPLD